MTARITKRTLGQFSFILIFAMTLFNSYYIINHLNEIKTPRVSTELYLPLISTELSPPLISTELSPPLISTELSPHLISAVYVEIRCHAGISLVLEQAIYHLGQQVKLLIWHSKNNAMYIQNLLKYSEGNKTELQKSFERGTIELHEFNPATFGDTDVGNVYGANFWYSKMYTSIEFWEHIDTPFAVTLQSDTLICRHVQNLDLKAPYIGGISEFMTNWPMLNERMIKSPVLLAVSDTPKANVAAQYHFNGGFSIRNVAWVHDCINQIGSRQKMNEDDLMNYCRDHLKSSKKVLEKDAYAFASDNGNTMCHNTTDGKGRVCPLGVHKPWVRKSSAGYSELLSNCPGLDKLEILQQSNHRC